MELFNGSEQTDIMKRNNLILGMTDSGKTIMLKKEVLKHLEIGNRVVLYDFQGQYKDIKKDIVAHELVVNSTEGICLFEFIATGVLDSEESEDLYRWKYILFCIQKTKSLLNLFDRKLNEREEKIIQDTVVKLLKINGITENTYATKEENANLLDFLMLLKQENEELYNEISHYKDSFTSRKTTLSLANQLNHISFDIHHIQKNERDLLLHSLLLMTNVYTQVSPPYSTVLIPDLSLFLSSLPLRELLAMTIKTGKKFNVTYIMVHHSLSDLIQSDGESMLANSSNFILYKQHKEEAEMLKYYFDLKEEEIHYLTTFPKGNSVRFGF